MKLRQEGSYYRR